MLPYGEDEREREGESSSSCGIWSSQYGHIGIGSESIWTILNRYHVQHEAGHFLVAYLLGVLPKGYTITSLDTLSKQGSLNVQAGTAFVDYEFLEEVSSINFWKKIIFKFLDYSKTPPSVFHLNVELAHILSQCKLDKLFRHLKCLDFF